MENLCQTVKHRWNDYASKSLSLEQQAEITRHLQTCSRCREFAYVQQFPKLLRASFPEPPPEPSEHYFLMLKQKLELFGSVHESGFAEIMVQQCWRLVPVLALLLVILVTSVSYEYHTIATLNQQPSIEEMLLFEDSSLPGQVILNDIITEEQADGK